MEQIMNYIKPELLVLVPVLYIIGAFFKASAAVPDKIIPSTLGVIGVALSVLWLLGTAPSPETANWPLLAFTALVQGLLCAGMAVYSNQIVKQAMK